MKLISMISNLKRVYIDNQLIITYQKTELPKNIYAGYVNIKEVAKRYYVSSKGMKLGSFMQNGPVLDLNIFLKENSSNISPKKSGSILDIGCGSGVYSLYFKSKYSPFTHYKYSGCEIDDAFVDVSRKIFPQYDFFKSYAHSIPAKDDSYSVVFCSGTLHYTLHNWQKSIKEMARITKDYLIITRLPITKYHKSFYVKQDVLGINGHETHYFKVFSRSDFESEIAKHGLKIVSRDYTTEEYPIFGVTEKIILNNYLLAKNDKK